MFNQREYNKKYRLEHKEELKIKQREYNKKYYQKHKDDPIYKEKMRERSNKWHQEHQELEKERKKKDYLRNKEKYRIKNKNWRKNLKNKEKQKIYNKKSHLKIRFGLSVEEYDTMIKKQNNKCASCGITFNENNNSERPCIDHDHKIGKIREILCNNCNLTLGIMSDDAEKLINLVKYLEKHNHKHK